MSSEYNYEKHIRTTEPESETVRITINHNCPIEYSYDRMIRDRAYLDCVKMVKFSGSIGIETIPESKTVLVVEKPITLRKL